GQARHHCALPQGLQRDHRLDVCEPGRGAALSRVLRPVGRRGPAHAEGVHPAGKSADRKDHGARREHEGRRAVQVHPGAARRRAAQGADPDPMSAQIKIGDIEVTALSDGVLAAPLDVVLGMDKAEAERLTGRTQTVPISVNAFLLKLGPKWALVDVGSGNTMRPTLGKLPDNLRAIGVTPEKIETIFLTHLHPDHSNGLVDDAGQAIYPNAEIVLHEIEARFWLDRDPTTGENERIRRNIAKAAVTTAPYRRRMRPVGEGEALPGVSTVLLAGHTPGPAGWRV